MRERQTALRAVANDNDTQVIVIDCHNLDRVIVDSRAGYLYWTDTGIPNVNEGSIERADLDGRNRTTIVPASITVRPKRLQLDKENGKLYWSDRSGARVMCSNLDGSHVETLIETGRGHRHDRNMV
jgi:hypothetical protein